MTEVTNMTVAADTNAVAYVSEAAFSAMPHWEWGWRNVWVLARWVLEENPGLFDACRALHEAVKNAAAYTDLYERGVKLAEGFEDRMHDAHVAVETATAALADELARYDR